jgi:hypothetical protein
MVKHLTFLRVVEVVVGHVSVSEIYISVFEGDFSKAVEKKTSDTFS